MVKNNDLEITSRLDRATIDRLKASHDAVT